MNPLRLFLVALLGVVALVVVPSALPVLHGTATGAESFGNVGALVVNIDGEPRQLCTATLVAPRVLLTAAHCTDLAAWFEEEIGDVGVTFADVPGPDSAVVDAIAFRSHPGGTPDRGPQRENCGYSYCNPDVGVVQLASAPAGIAPTPVAPGGYLAGIDMRRQPFTVVGYGINEIEGRIPTEGGTRRSGIFRALPPYDSPTPTWLRLTGEESGVETCRGDSGGPILANGFVVAVVSFGHGRVCASEGYNARVETPAVAGWLAATIAELS